MKIKKISVQNMVSPRSGREVANQFEIFTERGKYFQSYSSIIAFRSNSGEITLDSEKWDYSTTTGKYRNIFLRERIAETREKIKNGTYKLGDLN